MAWKNVSGKGSSTRSVPTRSIQLSGADGRRGSTEAQVAQLVERSPEEAGVPGSNPGLGTIIKELSILKPRQSPNLEKLVDIAHRVMSCQNCELCHTRTQSVPGGGSPDAKILFIGEAPGEEEDKQGTPFVGKAGQLLNEGLRNANIARDEIFITNAVKCRPPGNRNPSDVETEACSKYLQEQIAVLKPELIVVLGKVAAEFLLGREVKITKENGLLDFLDDGTVVLMVLHPAYVLRNQTEEIRKSFFGALKQAKELVSTDD